MKSIDSIDAISISIKIFIKTLDTSKLCKKNAQNDTETDSKELKKTIKVYIDNISFSNCVI